MAAILGDTINTLRARMRDFMPNSAQGNEVANKDLDWLNRAQQYLQKKYWKWEYQRVSIPVTLDPNRQFELPADFAAVYGIGYSVMNNGRPDIQYYAEDSDIATRYKVIPTYTQAGGTVLKIEWPATVFIPAAFTMIYSKRLDDFTDTTADRYSLFPGDLLLAAAKRLYCSERNVNDQMRNDAIQELQTMEHIFEESTVFQNQRQDIIIKNRFGYPTNIQSYTPDGQGNRGAFSPYPPAAWIRGI
jgi:hypothetical protein